MNRRARMCAVSAAVILSFPLAMPASANEPAKRRPPRPQSTAARPMPVAAVQSALLTPQAAAAAAGYSGVLTVFDGGENGCTPAAHNACSAGWTSAEWVAPFPYYALADSYADVKAAKAGLTERIAHWTQNGWVALPAAGESWAGRADAPDGSTASIIVAVRKGRNIAAAACTTTPVPADAAVLNACATAVANAQAARLTG